MPKDGISIPMKLKRDFILEVVFELRFETSTLPEILFGRLADHAPWQGFRQEPLPAYAIPAVMRQTDPNLRYQPVLQLSGEEGRRSIRIGPQVASYHRAAPYVGWAQFSAELEEFFQGFFERSENPCISRLGIRYINAATAELHGVAAITDLD
ncbi:MAG: TIGR04255 family protein, partial [Terracidiphilus sp.]